MVQMVNLMIMKQYVRAYNLTNNFLDILWTTFSDVLIECIFIGIICILFKWILVIFSTSSTLLHSDYCEFIKIFYM